MTRSNSLFATLLLVGASSALSTPGLSDPPAKTPLPPTSAPTPAQKAALVRAVGRLPLTFESNQGQTDAQVRFLAHNGASNLFLTPSEAVFSMPAGPQSALQPMGKTHSSSKQTAMMALRMQMVGANPKAKTLAQQPQPGRVNYLLGKDSSKWHTSIPTFGRAGFQGVYPGVDVVYYGNRSHLEYDFLVAPHADPKQIALRFAGAKQVRVNAAGELVIRMKDREMRWEKPAVYQQDATGKRAVAAHFRLKRLPNGQTGVGFALGRYDSSRPLVIDPVLLYSTYLSGSSYDTVTSIALNSSGNAFVAGWTTSTDFPVTAGVVQTVNHGGGTYSNAFVTKLNSTGTGLVYSTYLGGSSGDVANGIAVDSSGNAFVCGATGSYDFPITSGAFETTNWGYSGGQCGFVTKLNSTGTTLTYSTFLSSVPPTSVVNDRVTGIAVDSSGNAFVCGVTVSSTFPVTVGAYKTTKPSSTGTASAFVTKFNATGTGVSYSTFLGGSSADSATGIAIDNGGKAYVTGYASSTNFPTTAGVVQTVNNAASGSFNAFVTKVNPTGTALEYSTYLGGSASDYATGIALDSNYSAYIVGSASSTNFPTTTGAYQTSNNAPSGRSNAFVTKFNSTATSLVYSTYLGGNAGSNRYDAATGIAVDSAFNAYVTGYASSRDFPTIQGSFQRVNNAPTNDSNAFVTKLNTAGSTLMYSTFLGGTGAGTFLYGDQAAGIAIDTSGNVFVGGAANSVDYPTTSGAFQGPRTGGTNRNYGFVSKMSSFPIFPDVNNDGYTDLIFQDNTSNVVYAWYLNGLTVTAGSSISITPASGYKVVGTGDFTKTGHSDLLFQNTSTGALVIWYLNGAVYSSGTTITTVPASGYNVVGVADFNRDGWPDILFQNASTGQIVVWFMQGSTFLSGQSIVSSAPPVVGVGDFNQDGQPDIVVQTVLSGGVQVNIYYMNEATIASTSSSILFPLFSSRILAVGDYNNDGYADFVMNDPTGRADVYIQFMQNTTKLSNGALSITPPSTYRVVAPH